MDYLIDDLIDSSWGRASKSLPTNPNPPEPPLPPPSTLTKRKKTKSAKFAEGPSSSAAGSSKVPDTPIAAAVPLPETPTPVPSTRKLSDKAPMVAESAASPRTVPGLGAREQPDYFSAAERAPSKGASTGLTGSRISTVPATPTFPFYTPLTQLPPGPPVMSQPAEELPAAVEEMAGPTPAAEQQEPVSQPLEEAQRDLASSPASMLHVAHTPIPTVQSQPAMLVGISGSPSSGKTTFAHLLSVVLPPSTPCFVIRQDDFIVPEHLMVPPDDGELASHRHTVDFSAFKRFIEYSKREGTPPPAFKPPMADRERALSRVPPEMLEQLQSGLAGLPSLQDGRAVGIVEGGMLYHSETIRNLLDIKVLLRASREDSRSRHFDRFDSPHDGPERNSWDTREYFNRVIWPHYVQEHAALFDHDDVEGRPKSRLCKGAGISVQPYVNMSVEEVLGWIVGVLRRDVEQVAYRHDREVASVIDQRDEFEFCNCNEGFLGKIRQAIFDFL
ncbi:MAG: hypothetical protein L6R40_002111 [Gallowayella cf. fulva]|nr:MAG: hypothetical protein L6R40_002111 [Xanthomendoza cf. fulva]